MAPPGLGALVTALALVSFTAVDARASCPRRCDTDQPRDASGCCRDTAALPGPALSAHRWCAAFHARCNLQHVNASVAVAHAPGRADAIIAQGRAGWEKVGELGPADDSDGWELVASSSGSRYLVARKVSLHPGAVRVESRVAASCTWPDGPGRVTCSPALLVEQRVRAPGPAGDELVGKYEVPTWFDGATLHSRAPVTIGRPPPGGWPSSQSGAPVPDLRPIELPGIIGATFAVVGASVYVSNRDHDDNGALMAVPLIEGSPRVLASEGVDLDHVSARGSELIVAGKYGGAVRRVHVLGGELRTVLHPGAREVNIRGEHVYWLEPDRGRIRRMPMHGGAAEVRFERRGKARLLTSDATHLYVALFAGWHVPDVELLAVPIAGGAPRVLAAGPLDPNVLVAGATHLYWSSARHGTITRVPLAGGPVETVAEDQQLVHVVAATDALYWTTRPPHISQQCYDVPQPGHVMRAALDGSDPVVLGDFKTRWVHVAIADDMIYWSDERYANQYGDTNALIKRARR